MKIGIFLGMFFLGMNISARDVVSAHVATAKHAKMKLLILMPKEQSDIFKEIAPVLQRDLSFSGQFDVDVGKCRRFKYLLEVRMRKGLTSAHLSHVMT